MNTGRRAAQRALVEASDEARVRRALARTGLDLVASGHVERAPDGSVEGEVEMVFASGGHTFAIEVAGPRVARKRRAGAGFWGSRERRRALSAGLGLPDSNAVHLVRVDLGWARDGWPRASGPAVMLGHNHVEHLERMAPGGARRLFLEWNGL